ncbi:DUF6518 family protein [Kribbella sp. CA-293567]|uniref:DUF6518 family protein n=1 Tax=Kribbella sp. CA-293567 TaxID=3002436 RepID=UPI0022DE7EC5|nr:DUF6518 family protein [Kribbella sp. CA-293567]WBQ05540.1 DUF6518 family protein [Kribbella sp. CA-293567]
MTEHARVVRAVVGAVVVGLGLGFLTQHLQAYLPGNWNTLANSGVVWVVFAFAVTAVLRLPTGWSALLGFLTLTGALTGYYVSARFIEDATSSVSTMAVWAFAAIVGGPVFGIAGSWWSEGAAVRSTGSWLSGGGESLRSEARLWHLSRPVVGVALLSGAFLAEGIYFLWQVENKHASGRVEVVLAVLAPIMLARSNRDRFTGLLLLVPLGLAGIAFYGLLDLLLAG